jgi:sugar lactone lactonase YvrE
MEQLRNVEDLSPAAIISAANTVGEGVLWDARRKVLWWTDIPACRLHRLHWGESTPDVIAVPERLASFGLMRGSDCLIAAFASGIAQFDPLAGSVQWLHRPAFDGQGLRFNDGRVDRQGRFWAGTMVEDDRETDDGELYCVERAGAVRRRMDGIRISNGLCMSPDGKRLYFADSPTHTIREFELIEPGGTLGASREFARTAPGAFPDGATIDADGCLWSAQWGGGCVVRYTPGGRIDRTIRIPTRQPSCVCFAGPALDVLCVTSARENLDARTLAREPNAGDVFLYRVGVQGLAEEEFST